MRKWCALAAAAVFSALATTAEAGFQFNYTVTPGVDALAGKNVFRFYAKNDQTGGQAGSIGLLAFEVHFKTVNQPFTFDFRDIDGDGLTDANIFGKGYNENTAVSTFMQLGTYADPNIGDNNGEFFPFRPLPNTYSTKSGAANPTQTYGSLTDFFATGFSQNKLLDATQGLGRFFGAAVVPDGVDINVFGLVAAEKGSVANPNPTTAGNDALLVSGGFSPELRAKMAGANVEQGPQFPFNFTATAPEPGAATLLAACGFAATLRRRRHTV